MGILIIKVALQFKEMPPGKIQRTCIPNRNSVSYAYSYMSFHDAVQHKSFNPGKIILQRTISGLGEPVRIDRREMPCI
jgi:hypothetical protein